MWIKNNRGFTLYETIFSLFILSIIIFIIPFILNFFTSPQTEKLHKKEVELFFINISREIHNAKNMYVNDGELIIVLQNNDKASYEQYQNMIRRRVNKQGHEVLLQNIESVHFEIDEHLVTVSIHGKHNETYERNIALLGENR